MHNFPRSVISLHPSPQHLHVYVTRLLLTCRSGWTAAAGARPASGSVMPESRGARRQSRLLRCLSRPLPRSSCMYLSASGSRMSPSVELHLFSSYHTGAKANASCYEQSLAAAP